MPQDSLIAGRMVAAELTDRLALPLIAAPMFRVSNPALVIAACRAGIVGAFPTANCRSLDELDEWLGTIAAALADGAAADGGAATPVPAGPVCANLIIRQPRLAGDLDRLIAHRVPLVVTSVGSPAEVVAPLHAAGARVFADVASLRHAEKAAAAGADGLVLLTAGAGGQTGWANPFAFVRAVRGFFAGPLVLAGGIGDGHALWAARALGADLGYMGTRFIAARESGAAEGYRAMLVDATLDDVMTTRAFTGLDSNMLRPSIVAAGLDPDALAPMTAAGAAPGALPDTAAPRRWRDIWSAGHSVSQVADAPPVADVVRRIRTEYDAARAAALAL